MPLHYFSGEEMRHGDYVLWHSHPGILEATNYPADGFLVNPQAVFIGADLDDELCDIDFIARSGPAVFAPMTIDNYDAVHAILSRTPGVTLRAADSRGAFERYLARNTGLSLIARVGDEIAGCVLCGHDGRRGYLHHLAVAPEARRRGIATLLVAHCIVALRDIGIEKVHADVLADNELGHQFWSGLEGWRERDDIVRYSFTSVDDPNA